MSEIQFEHKVLWNQKKSYAEDIISEYVKSLQVTPLPLEEEVSPPPSHPLRPCGQIADSEEMLTDDCSSAQVFQKITFATAEEIHAMQSNDNRDTVSPTNSFFVTWFINCDGYEGDSSRACASPPEHVPVIEYGGDPEEIPPPPTPTPGCAAGGCDGFYRPVACQPCVATPPPIYNGAGQRIGGGAPPGAADVYTDPNGLSNCNEFAPGRPNVTKRDGTFLPATAPCVPGFRILNNLPDSNADNSGFSTLESWALNNSYQPTRLMFDGCFDPATDTMEANCYHKFGFGEQTYNKKVTSVSIEPTRSTFSIARSRWAPKNPCDGTGAIFGYATVSSGVITGVEIISGGTNYCDGSALSFTQGSGLLMLSGSGATAKIVAPSGVITGVNITNGGSGYSGDITAVPGAYPETRAPLTGYQQGPFRDTAVATTFSKKSVRIGARLEFIDIPDKIFVKTADGQPTNIIANMRQIQMAYDSVHSPEWHEKFGGVNGFGMINGREKTQEEFEAGQVMSRPPVPAPLSVPSPQAGRSERRELQPPNRRRGCVGCAPPARKGRNGVYRH